MQETLKNMRETLGLFTSQSLEDASRALLDYFGIKYTPIVRGVPFDSYFEQNDFCFQYVEEAKKCLEHIWNIGYVNDTTFTNKASCDVRYDSLSVFACEVRSDVNFTRGLAVDITRAFNRVSSRQVNFAFDMPVVVLMLQKKNENDNTKHQLSIATCERFDRKDGIGQRMGRVTILRNINCEKPHTGHCQILERVANDVRGCSTYEELHQKWFKSFNIDILSDEFFEGYKAIYEDIIEYVTGKRMVKEANKWAERDNHNPCDRIMEEFAGFANPEKAVRDYVKKLMGRLVFIQFLQKKGWMGVPAGDSWKNGDHEFLQNLFRNSDKKETFVDDILEPLFNDLNTPRHGDLFTLDRSLKVPYLNGGLFELDESDDTKFALPSCFLEKLLDFFASYNFTIAENSPDDVEIGVDPEMLGRIFENLLEDNKEKGAFYTPKEIVRYMCRESLTAYLTTCVIKKQGVNHKPECEIRESVRRLLEEPGFIVPKMTKEHLADFGKYIRDVKICDPAIGSGAFPMGLLNELVRCRAIIGAWAIDSYGNLLTGDYAALKAEIICNNIYGVDIEKGAIDIARLRFWLSIIVDLKVPHALPNFEYKFMQGNSLITTFNGVYVNLDTKNQQHVKVNEMKAEKQKLYGFKQQYYASQGRRKHELAVEIKKSILRLVSMQLGYELRSWYEKNVAQTTIDYEGQGNDIAFTEIKSQLPQNKQNIVNLAETLYKQLNDNNVDVAKRSLIDIGFFDWRMMFTEVFDVEDGNGGFDIVIGNPPYIDSETMVKVMPKERELYAKKFECASGNWDMFIVFIELSISILKEKGVFSNIIPNKLIASKYGVELRKHLSSKHVIEIRDYSRIDVFKDAAVYPITIVLCNDETEGNTLFTTMKNRIDVIQSNIAKSISLTKNDYWDPFFVDSPIFNLISKINTFNPLKDLSVEVLGSATVADAYEIKNIIIDSDSHEGFKLVNSGTIDPYIQYWGIKPCRYIKGSYMYPVVSSSDLKNYSEVRYSQAASAKIIVASMTTKYEACLDVIGEYIAGKSTTIIMGDNKTLYKLTAIINSKLASYWLNVVFNSLKMSGGAINIGKNELQILPIPKKDYDFEELVKRVIECKASSNLTDFQILEHEINNIIYDLYGLTYEERLIVDPEYKE